MKPIRLTKHALEQCLERGTNEDEVKLSIEKGVPEPVKMGRLLYRYNLPFGGEWQNQYYAIKQVASVIKEEDTEIVVITVYTFYF